MMRLISLIVIFLFGSSLAAAFAAVPDVLFRGTVTPLLTRNAAAYCSADVGPTSFQRSSTDQALISFPNIYYALFNGADAPTYFTLSGTARLSFANAHHGKIKFDQPDTYPADVRQPVFSQYSETYNATLGRLIVKFQIVFASCTLDVSNIYWN